MFEITRLTVEHLAAGCVTDCSTPRIGFSLSSDRQGAQLADAELTVGDWSAHVTSGQSAAYVGPALLPFTTYSVRLNATDDAGETATATTTFETGRMGTPWKPVDQRPELPLHRGKGQPLADGFPQGNHNEQTHCPRAALRHSHGHLRARAERPKAGRAILRPRLHELQVLFAVSDIRCNGTFDRRRHADLHGCRRLGGGQLCVYPQKPRDR